MKKIFALSLAVISILTLASCNGGLAKKDKGFGSGKNMSLRFETNPSTGYDWEWSLMTGDNLAVIEFDREEYEMNENMDVVGSPSYRTYYFVARKDGKQSLTFTYRRPWEGGEAAYNVVYELSVDKNLNITCLSKMKGDIDSDKELSFFPNPKFE